MINLQDYQRDGYFVVQNFIPENICLSLMRRARQLMDEHWSDEFKTVFSTREDQYHVKHRYFLESGNKIRLFFEEGAMDDAGNLKFARENCINKIGHALHDLDAEFSAFSHSSKIKRQYVPRLAHSESYVI